MIERTQHVPTRKVNVEQKVKVMLADASGLFSSQISLSKKLDSLGIDEQDLADLLSDLEDDLGVELMSDDTPEMKDVSQLIAYVTSKVNP